MGYLFFHMMASSVAMIGLSRLNIGKEFLSFVEGGKTSTIYSTGLRKNAEAGIVRSQADLGWCYEHGSGVAKNKAKALKWCQTAANMGNVSAECRLAKLVGAEA